MLITYKHTTKRTSNTLLLFTHTFDTYGASVSRSALLGLTRAVLWQKVENIALVSLKIITQK